MKYWTLPFLMASVAQVACSGGGTGADDTSVLNDPTTFSDGADLAFDTSNLMNDGGIGPTPNYWSCRLRQNNSTVALETSYQFFTDLSGVSYLGAGSVYFSWDVTGAESGYIDIVNDSGNIPVERWFVSMRSPTRFSAAMVYAESQNDLEGLSAAQSSGDINCVLYADDGVLNPDDEGILEQLSDGNSGGSDGDITSIAQSLLNTDSEFGLESQLWQCTAIDGSLDLLLGFYRDGIGGVYNTRTGELQGSQTTYTVSEIDGVGNVSIDAVLNNEADQLTLSSLVFDPSGFFDARLQTAVNNEDVLITCNTLNTAELAL
ncbi:MAG: hypothetical protein AB8B97_00910 [Granulosicoccus sp.]